MENNSSNQTDQATYSQNLSSPINPPVSDSNKKELNLWKIVSLLLLAIVIVGGISMVMLLSKNSGSISNTENTTEITPTTTVTATLAPKISISKAVSSFCVNSKINLDKLPFTISPSLKNSYNMQDSIGCVQGSEGYAFISLTDEVTLNSKNIAFFDQNSKWVGMGGDPFQPIENYKTIQVNGGKYSFEIAEPGPYGISTLGPWVILKGEKKDLSSGTIARISVQKVIKDQQVLNLIKKYGISQLSSDGVTIYSLDQAKKDQFMNEVIPLISQLNEIKQAASEVTTDLTNFF